MPGPTRPMPSTEAASAVTASPGAAEDQAAIRAPEAEGVAHHARERCGAVLEQVLHRERGIHLVGVDTRRHQPVSQRECADHRLQRARGAERVTGGGLARARRDPCAEYL